MGPVESEILLEERYTAQVVLKAKGEYPIWDWAISFRVVEIRVKDRVNQLSGELQGRGLREAAESIGEFLSHERGVRGYTWHQDEDSAEKLNSTEQQWFTERHSVKVLRGSGGGEEFCNLHLKYEEEYRYPIVARIITTHTPVMLS